MIADIPLPARDGPFEQGFWQALDQNRLAHQQCANCSAWYFPARWRCQCRGALTYRYVSGRAKLWSWTFVHAPVLPAFATYVPYAVGIAELEESPALRMVGSLILSPDDAINAVTADPLWIGRPLIAVVRDLGNDVRWPVWQLA